MEFVRQNLVLIVVAVVVVVVGGVLLAANMSMGKTFDAAAAERQTLSTQLKDLDKNRINDLIVDKEEQRVTKVKSSLAEVITQSVDWNRRNLVEHMLAGNVLGPDGKNVKVQAFPEENVTYDEYHKLKLTQGYTEQLPALLEPLKMATPPTNADVLAMVPAATRQLQQTSDAYKTASSDDPTLKRDAIVLAREMVRQDSALGKHIYVDPEALAYSFREPKTDVTPGQLWAAQLNLWVTADVLDAIRLANQEVVDKAIADGALAESVSLSAVRHLRSLAVLGYSLSGGSGVPGRGMASLTGRQSDKLYDVVYYRLSVIMPARHVADFERVLTSHNYHTILNVTMRAVQQDSSDLHYYGSGPVMEVAFTGELLLLSGWQRGTWDVQASAWSADYPPLMPVSVLRGLPAQARRDSDNERLKQAEGGQP